MNPARAVLERLLDRAEKARLRGDAKPVSLSMQSRRDAREYHALSSLPQLETFHAAIRLAEREGAITAQRERHRGDGEKLLRIDLVDADALARHLGVETIATRAARASDVLATWSVRFPVIAETLDAWRDGRKARGFGPDTAGDLADAARGVDALLADARTDRVLRKQSALLFGDSKRLEALTPWLDTLISGELEPSGMEKEQVWAALGLRKDPLPLLLAGSGAIELDDGTRLPLPGTYLGVPVEALRAVETTARAVLSIENLASFHETARLRGDAPILLFYTGGMPSPAWRAAYLRLLRRLPTGTPIHHWGDIDEGGFRIAAKLADTAREAGFTLRPWRMDPTGLSAVAREHAKRPSAATLASMCRSAERAGWPQVVEALRQNPLLLEQETLDPVLP